MKLKDLLEILQSMNRKANHQLGQNFLVNQLYSDMITSRLEIKEGENVLEIGSGLGALSEYLVNSLGNITLLEYDRDFYQYLENKFKNPNTKVICGDILQQDLTGFEKIVGNLPYYITTPIIKKVLLEADSLKTFVFMVQKEVGLKLLEQVNSKEYGPIQILFAYLGNFKSELTIKPSSFYPQPHVDSVVLSLTLKENIDHDFKRFYFQNLQYLFRFSRKNLRNNLKGSVYESELEGLFERNGISLETRPHQIAPQIYESIILELYQNTTKRKK